MTRLYIRSVRSILPRRPIRSIGQLNSRYYSTTSSTQNQEESEFLPLPRALGPSKALLLLSLPIAPEHWPSHLDLYSTLYRRAVKDLKGEGVAVNCIYDGQSTRTSFEEKDVYPARLFRGHGGVDSYPEFKVTTIEQVKVDLSTPSFNTSAPEQLEILVCTHGSRDCRCSDHGGALVDSLRQEVRTRGLEEKVRVGEIAHVGGHKYAANALVLPSLDMYSNLRHSDAKAMIDHLLSTTSTTSGDGYDVTSTFWDHWRGKYGTAEIDQAAIWSRIDPSTPASTFNHAAQATPTAEGVLTFRTWEGDRRTVPCRTGETLLQVARKEDLPSMEGTCGGNLECSTCHLYVDGSAPIPEASDEELDMLDYALGYREGESRLGCQIKVDEKLLEWCKAGGELKLPRY